MVNALKETIQKAAVAFAEEIVAKTTDSVKADLFASLATFAGAPVKVKNGAKHPGRPKGSKNKAKSASDAIVVATNCLEPGCKEKRLAKGLCRKHYYKNRREKNAKSEQAAIANDIDAAVAESLAKPPAPAPF